MKKQQKEQTQWVKLKGMLVYDPVREGMKKVRPQRSKVTTKVGGEVKELEVDRMLIVQLNPHSKGRDGFDLLYQWFLRQRKGPKVLIHRPMWGPHITVVNGREQINEKLWRKYQGQMIDFEYSPELMKVWRFWVLPVRSEKLQQIRQELGLKPSNKLHITIGRIDDAFAHV